MNLCPEFLHGKPAPPTDESDQAKQLRYSGEFKAFEDRIANLISKDARRWRDEHKAERYDDLVQLRGYIEDDNADDC